MTSPLSGSAHRPQHTPRGHRRAEGWWFRAVGGRGPSGTSIPGCLVLPGTRSWPGIHGEAALGAGLRPRAGPGSFSDLGLGAPLKPRCFLLRELQIFGRRSLKCVKGVGRTAGKLSALGCRGALSPSNGGEAREGRGCGGACREARGDPASPPRPRLRGSPEEEPRAPSRGVWT